MHRRLLPVFTSALLVGLAIVALTASPAGAQVAPANDFYSGAIVLNTSGSNVWPFLNINTDAATEQTGEDRVCTIGGVSTTFYDTIWWKFTPTYAGSFLVQASGYDSVIGIYQNAGNTLPTSGRCFDIIDNSLELVGGPVTGGTTYAIQIGDTWRHPSLPCCVSVLISYLADRDSDSFYDDRTPLDRCISIPGGLNGCPDADSDGFSPHLSPADCNDSLKSVYPGAPEVLNNDHDDNCNGAKGYDRDRDGSAVGDPNQDCNDGNAGIHPGAREVRGNGVDENCDGDAVGASAVGSTIRQSLSWFRKYTRIAKIQARGLLRGSRVTVRCKVRRCKLRRRSQKVKGRSSMSLQGWFRNRKVRVGTVIQIAIHPPNGEYLGKVRSLKIRSNKAPKETNRCIAAGSSRPIRCP
jgi:hypothetical protein